MCEQMNMLQLPGQIELLCDVISKNENSFPIQDFSPDQVPLTYIDSSPAQTHKAQVCTTLNIVIYKSYTVCKVLVSFTVRATMYFMTNGQSTCINFFTDC